MFITIQIAVALALSLANCSSKIAKQQFDCTVVDNVVEYLSHTEMDFKGNRVAVFNRTDALPFSSFKQEIQANYPQISIQTVDSLDSINSYQKISCNYKKEDPGIELVFSNSYKSLIVCEWFYIDRLKKPIDINDMRRFNEAKICLIELGKDSQIKRVFKKTMQYE